MKNEANTFFAISNFNKSIELNNSILKLIENKKKLFLENLKKNNFSKNKEEYNFNKSKTNNIVINCYNNRGNSYLKNNNFKEAINDFTIVLEKDIKNIKAFFRRGVAYYNNQIFNVALKDFKEALNLANENERGNINNYIEKTLNEINSHLKNKKSKSENFEISQDSVFKKIFIKEIDENIISEVKNLKNIEDIPANEEQMQNKGI